ncbi:MAG: hypothetical protein KDE27_20645, partial [Planctomycetes bacterium]|nr:hypothetical protein [Planctomycetota bacterium]
MAVEGPADPALRRSRLPVAILLVAVVATFSPALFGNYAWDDTHLIAHNGALLRSDLGALLGEPLFGMQRGFWRPITLLVLWVGHQLGGAFGVHLLALLLHGGNCVLVLGLARRWLLPWPALWVALLFALHPVQVESVAWCAAINDPLWVLFALLAIGSAVRWRDRGSRGLPWATAGCVLA